MRIGICDIDLKQRNEWGFMIVLAASQLGRYIGESSACSLVWLKLSAHNRRIVGPNPTGHTKFMKNQGT